MKIDTNLSWQYHVNNLSIKLNRANALLFKMRKYVSFKTLRSIYFAVSDSQLSCCSLVWSQNCGTVQRFLILQKRLLESSIFNQGLPIPVSYSSKARSYNFKIKFTQRISYLSVNLQIIYHYQSLIHSLVQFSFFPDQHNYKTSSSTQGSLIKLFYMTNRYGNYSITVNV